MLEWRPTWMDVDSSAIYPKLGQSLDYCRQFYCFFCYPRYSYVFFYCYRRYMKTFRRWRSFWTCFQITILATFTTTLLCGSRMHLTCNHSRYFCERNAVACTSYLALYLCTLSLLQACGKILLSASSESTWRRRRRWVQCNRQHTLFVCLWQPPSTFGSFEKETEYYQLWRHYPKVSFTNSLPTIPSRFQSDVV